LVAKVIFFLRSVRHHWVYQTEKLFFCLVLFCLSLLVSCITNDKQKERENIVVYGMVVETMYTEEMIFAAIPLPGVHVMVGPHVIMSTNRYGEYKFYIKEEGNHTISFRKEDFKTEYLTLYNVRKGDKLLREVYLEKLDEQYHGWNFFPMGQVDSSITPDGLRLSSNTTQQLYATQTVTLKNMLEYKFTAMLMRHKGLTKTVYFGMKPQIDNDEDWVYDRIEANGWRPCIIRQYIFDNTKIDSTMIDGKYEYRYPETVDVVLKLGVEYGSDTPTGYFNFIKIEKN